MLNVRRLPADHPPNTHTHIRWNKCQVFCSWFLLFQSWFQWLIYKGAYFKMILRVITINVSIYLCHDPMLASLSTAATHELAPGCHQAQKSNLRAAINSSNSACWSQHWANGQGMSCLLTATKYQARAFTRTHGPIWTITSPFLSLRWQRGCIEV